MAGKTSIGTTRQQIGQLADSSRDELVAAWIKAYGHPPPKGIKRALLERAAAYALQLASAQGLKPATTKALLSMAAGKLDTKDRFKKTLKPGARLIRTWNGRVYQVDVTGRGFVCNGQTYRSLSAVARAITGTNWSGQRFFGL